MLNSAHDTTPNKKNYYDKKLESNYYVRYEDLERGTSHSQPGGRSRGSRPQSAMRHGGIGPREASAGGGQRGPRRPQSGGRGPSRTAYGPPDDAVRTGPVPSTNDAVWTTTTLQALQEKFNHLKTEARRERELCLQARENAMAFKKEAAVGFVRRRSWVCWLGGRVCWFVRRRPGWAEEMHHEDRRTFGK